MSAFHGALRRVAWLAAMLLSAAALVSAAPGEAGGKAPETAGEGTELTRGNYLRTDVRDRKISYAVLPTLAVDGADRQLVLKLRRERITSQTEVRIYDTMVRFFVTEKDGTGYFDFKTLPGDEWVGEQNTRQFKEDAGTMANLKVIVDDVPCHTDSDGVVRADRGRLDLLEVFDDLSCRTRDCLLRFPDSDMAMRTYRIYRTMPQRKDFDEKRLDEPPEQDLLVAYKLDFKTSERKPEQDRLECKVDFPADFAFAVAGEPFPLRVRVENHGNYRTSCLIGRLFSRVAGVDGKLFYFGAIPPGEAREFTRYITAPADLRTGKVFAELRFSDSWDAPRLAQTIEFAVLRQK